MDRLVPSVTRIRLVAAFRWGADINTFPLALQLLAETKLIFLLANPLPIPGRLCILGKHATCCFLEVLRM